MPEFVTLNEYARFENRVLSSLRELREEVADAKALVLNVQTGLQAHIDTVALELNSKIDSLKTETRANAQFTTTALMAICAHMGIELPRQ